MLKAFEWTIKTKCRKLKRQIIGRMTNEKEKKIERKTESYTNSCFGLIWEKNGGVWSEKERKINNKTRVKTFRISSFTRM